MKTRDTQNEVITIYKEGGEWVGLRMRWVDILDDEMHSPERITRTETWTWDKVPAEVKAALAVAYAAMDEFRDTEDQIIPTG